VDPLTDENVVRFSLAHGGPFHALLRAARLARDDGRDARRQSAAFVVVAWVPLALVAFVQRLATGRWNALTLDPALHVRLLVSVPLLLVADQAMHVLSVRCIDRLLRSGLVHDAPRAVGQVVARAQRLRDAKLAEIAMVVAGVVAGQAALWGHFSPFGSGVPGAAAPPLAARVWWSVVALPLTDFFMLRALWRWVIWTFFLWSLARLDLRPLPLHPDRRGGLALLGEPSLAFAIVVLAAQCLFAAAWYGEIVFQGLPLRSCAVPLAQVAVVSAVFTLGPLGVFTWRMWCARFVGLRQYDTFALDYAQLFHRKWIEGPGDETLLGSADIQAMADMANTLAIVRGMKLLPFGWHEVAALALALVVPLVPLVLAVVPLHELLRRMAGLLVAALPG
jgi:hypothetical protein